MTNKTDGNQSKFVNFMQVTGANSGIGFQAAKNLAQRNASVVMASRNEESGQRY